MYQNDSYRKPITTERFPITGDSMKKLRKCGCGRMTFLSMPCPECGSSSGTAVMGHMGRAGASFNLALLLIMLCGGAVLTAAAVLLLGWIAGMMSLLLIIAAAAYIGAALLKINREDRRFFWQVHSDHRKLFKKEPDIPVLESKLMEPVIDAWYLDIDRLERMALEGDWDKALVGARELACVFRNARLSRLMYRALLNMQGETRELFELDEICANLTPADIDDVDTLPFLKMIEAAVRECCCQSYDNVKRIFAALIGRYQERIEKTWQVTGFADILGEEFFTKCGGYMTIKDGKSCGMIPDNDEDRRGFYTNLTREIMDRRSEVIEDGTWLPVLREIGRLDPSGSDSFITLEYCFLNHEAHLESGNCFEPMYSSQFRDHPALVFHPELRRFFAGVVGRLIVDENGTIYTESSDPLLRDLAAEVAFAFEGQHSAHENEELSSKLFSDSAEDNANGGEQVSTTDNIDIAGDFAIEPETDMQVPAGKEPLPEGSQASAERLRETIPSVNEGQKARNGKLADLIGTFSASAGKPHETHLTAFEDEKEPIGEFVRVIGAIAARKGGEC